MCLFGGLCTHSMMWKPFMCHLEQDMYKSLDPMYRASVLPLICFLLYTILAEAQRKLADVSRKLQMTWRPRLRRMSPTACPTWSASRQPARSCSSTLSVTAFPPLPPNPLAGFLTWGRKPSAPGPSWPPRICTGCSPVMAAVQTQVRTSRPTSWRMR